MSDLSDEAKDLLVQFQSYQQQLQNVYIQKENLKIQEMEIEKALEELEKAIDARDNRKIGACLYELRQALKEADREAHQTTGR